MHDKSLTILTAVFVASLTIASILASKIINIYGIFVPAGILAYSLTFMMSDTICEIWGKKEANNVVFSGFISLVAVAFLIKTALIMPPAPFWQNQDAFSTILGSSTRIIIASLTAYAVSQYNDVFVYLFIRSKTGRKHLWLRNNLSTAMSQLLDSVIFIMIAFYGQMPVVPLILGQWLVKLAVAICNTPFVYAMVWFLRNRRQDLAQPERA